MLRSGWSRLWVVLTAFALAAAFGWAVDYVWLAPPCYRFEGITPGKNLSAQNQSLIASIKNEAIGREVCSASLVAPLLTIQELAKRGSVTQVTIAWRGPEGWSYATESSLDVLDGKEITAHNITSSMARDVAADRLPHAIETVGTVLSISALLLVLGLGIAWVRRGFWPDRD